MARKGTDEEEKEDAKKKGKEEGGDVSAEINAKREDEFSAVSR